MIDTPTVMAQLDAQIAAVEQAHLTPVCIILNYEDHWTLSYQDLGGPGVGYPRAHPYYSFVPSYLGLEVICPGLAYDGPPTIGVRAAGGDAGEAARRALERAYSDLVGFEGHFERLGSTGTVASIRKTIDLIEAALAPTSGDGSGE